MRTPEHPGTYVREQVIPNGMTVKTAAERLGIGRPALSNFLNGNSSLSQDMAARLHATFGADRDHLLDMQSQYDRAVRPPSQYLVRAFVPSFLTIRAHQIESWAGTDISARSKLAVLLRKLVHSTSQDLHLVDFPGYDNAERHGSDGVVEAGSPTPWVPIGKSYWEFGTNKDPKTKAENDYNSKLAINPDERASSTYVTVTPRNWEGKGLFEAEKNKARDWQRVRALDASDLEQWLEQSVPAQIWLAEEMGLPTEGFETLEQFWARWAGATSPSLHEELFAPAVETHRQAFGQWLEREPSGPFAIAADSRGEGLAFLRCLLLSAELDPYRDRTAIFYSAPVLRKLIESEVPFIPIANSEEAERELGSACRRIHTVVLRTRNPSGEDANARLDLLTPRDFQTALESMGVAEDQVDRLSRESGRSITVLRRRLSTIPAIRQPDWASDKSIGRALLPAVFTGSWDLGSNGDREVISRLAGADVSTIEMTIAAQANVDDPPVWSEGAHRGVVSQVDALFAIAPLITIADIRAFLEAAKEVLSELDPALDLPEKDRFAAPVYGKVRQYSGALRRGLCDMLILLSINGQSLFGTRQGMEISSRVGELVGSLLSPMTPTILESHASSLPIYAEAAPEVFLQTMEEDLRQPDSSLVTILRPAVGFPFVSSPRTGLLWALECLAWNPRYLSRTLDVLAALAAHESQDNLASRPSRSLRAILSAAIPQTSSPIDQRVRGLHRLARQHPAVTWSLCIDELRPGTRFAVPAYRPRWRGDASGAGQYVGPAEHREFLREALGLALNWRPQTEQTLGDLVGLVDSVEPSHQEEIWSLVSRWAETAVEPEKARLRERIRKYALTRPQGRRRRDHELDRVRARVVYQSLEPEDLVLRYQWLFAQQWVDESADELEEEHLDYKARLVRIDKRRKDAIAEIWNECGLRGIQRMASASHSPFVVGSSVAACVQGQQSRVEFIQSFLLPDDQEGKAQELLRGFLWGLGDEQTTAIVQAVSKDLDGDAKVRLLTYAPFNRRAWRMADELGQELRDAYWRQVNPTFEERESEEAADVVLNLLQVGRPLAAFHSVRFNLDKVGTPILMRLLDAVAAGEGIPEEHLRVEDYQVSEALDALDARDDVLVSDMARLELIFLEALEHTRHGSPNLERKIAEDAAFFAYLVVVAHQRQDGGEDPPGLSHHDPGARSKINWRVSRLLGRARVVPGTNGSEDSIDGPTLQDWIAEARALCASHGRIGPGDQWIGQLLSRSSRVADNAVPDPEICQVLEDVSSDDMGEGYLIGVANSRGMHMRGPGGELEWDLARKFRVAADAVRDVFPFVGQVLDRIAKMYEFEAAREDTEGEVYKRLH